MQLEFAMIGWKVSRVVKWLPFVVCIMTSFAYNDVKINAKYAGSSFKNHTIIGSRLVTCDRRSPLMMAEYVTDVWFCDNIRVDEQRMAHGYMPGLGKKGCGGDEEDTASNDIDALCRQLLYKHDIYIPLWAAIITKASCDYSPDNRVIFNGTVSHWTDLDPGRGFVITLLCQLQPS